MLSILHAKCARLPHVTYICVTWRRRALWLDNQNHVTPPRAVIGQSESRQAHFLWNFVHSRLPFQWLALGRMLLHTVSVEFWRCTLPMLILDCLFFLAIPIRIRSNQWNYEIGKWIEYEMDHFKFWISNLAWPMGRGKLNPLDFLQIHTTFSKFVSGFGRKKFPPAG